MEAASFPQICNLREKEGKGAVGHMGAMERTGKEP